MRIGCLVVMVVVGCGEDGKATIDAPVPIDGAIDAPACGFTVAPTQPARMTGGCNAVTQLGCDANEKCTWVQFGAEGAMGCAPVGHAQDNCACTVGATGATGYDDCAAGLMCLDGRCAAICDGTSTTQVCDAMEACTYHPTFFLSGSPTPSYQAAVCAKTCDPLTQVVDETQMPACGSPDPSAPTRGCSGYDAYTCRDAGPLALTDRELPAMLTLGACAPGFFPFFYETTGSTVARCTGYCSPLEIDNTPAHAANHKGSATALGKLPTQPQPRAGDATCDIGKKGSDASSTCVYMWPFLRDELGVLPPAFANSRHLDGLGVCMARAFFLYDPTGGTNPNTPFPDCATLPPRSVATPGMYDDAADWSCQKRANSSFTAATIPGVRFGFGSPVPMLRHQFD